MAKRNKFDYFAAFEKQSEIACEAADALVEAIKDFTTAENLRGRLEEAHHIEQRGDEANHEILNSVAVDFITPIDREDIIDMAHRMDSVTDNIEGVMQCLYMYDAKTMHSNALDFALILQNSTHALHRAMGEFHNFKKSETLRDLLEEVNVCEEKGDMLYLTTIRNLYVEESDHPMRVAAWSRIFDRMEKACDACEHVADTMSSVVLKNM